MKKKKKKAHKVDNKFQQLFKQNIRFQQVSTKNNLKHNFAELETLDFVTIGTEKVCEFFLKFTIQRVDDKFQQTLKQN